MSKIATLDSVSDALDTQAKWLRVMQKAGVTHEQFILPMNDKKARLNLATYLAAGCPKLSDTTATTVTPTAPAVARTLCAAYQEAVEVLGDDLLIPEEIMEDREGIVYTADQLTEFENSLPSKEELVWLRDNGFILVPGPHKPLSCLDIRTLNPQYFYSKTGGWYAEDQQKFSREEKVTTKWLKLRKGPVPNSTRKNWDEQMALVSGVEYVPNDAEVEWGVTTFKAVRDIYLLQGIYVRTSSRVSDGYRVYVGCFGQGGLSVGNCWDVDRDDGLGVASARK